MQNPGSFIDSEKDSRISCNCRAAPPGVWLSLAATLMAWVAGSVPADPSLPLMLADVDRNKLLDTLDQRLVSARPGDQIDVIITFRAPLHQINFPLVQRQIGAFGRTRPLGLVRSVATRLDPAQIATLSRAGIVEQIEADERVYAHRMQALEYDGVTRARVEAGLTGDGDGQPELFGKRDHTIAILDTGIDGSHTELSGGKVIGWKDLINNRAVPYDDSTRLVNGERVPLGHGTHVASIAAGRIHGEHSGVAPGAALVGVKVLDGNGSALLSTIAEGIEWCVANAETYGIRTLNLSLGSSLPSAGDDVVSRAVDAAAAAGLIVVCSAGNSGPGQGTIGSPGAARGALTVGAVADPGEGGSHIASFSSRGPTLDGRLKPDIVAPGVGITAALINSPEGTDRLVAYSGTSMSAPYVAGFVALMLQIQPDLTPDEVFTALTGTARDFGPEGPDTDFGHGILNGSAVFEALGFTTGATAPLPGHAALSGSITRQQRVLTHSFDVAGTEFPLAISLIMPDWYFFFRDLDAQLVDPNGVVVASSASASRQETLRWNPTIPGRYTIRVFGYRRWDTGDYILDISGPLTAPETLPALTLGEAAPTLSLGPLPD